MQNQGARMWTESPGSGCQSASVQEPAAFEEALGMAEGVDAAPWTHLS